MTTTEVAKAKPGKSDEFEIRVTYNGIEEKLTVAPDQPVSSLLAEAVKLFTIAEAQHLLALFDKHGIEITNEAQTADEAGLKKNARLVLRQSAVKGG